MSSSTSAGNNNKRQVKITYVIPYHKKINKKFVNNVFNDFLKEYERVMTVEEFINIVVDKFNITTTSKTFDVTIRPKLTEEQILYYVCNHSMDTFRNHRTETLERCPEYLYKIVKGNTKCYICLDNIREGAQIYICGCIYHIQSLQDSYGYSYLCPICQIDIRDQQFIKDPDVHEIIV